MSKCSLNFRQLYKKKLLNKLNKINKFIPTYILFRIFSLIIAISFFSIVCFAQDKNSEQNSKQITEKNIEKQEENGQKPSLSTSQENPFSGFETIILPNGLKIWYKYLPNDTNISLSVSIPYGFDNDPIGKEQLAHFTEHMLFSDHLGRTEEQIKKEIEDLGGVRNAYTSPDQTFYFVRIDKKHGLFALDWLYKIVSPHEMDEKVVERQREPVAIEVGARKRELFDWIDDYYLNPRWLRPPNFWAREFGADLFPDRDFYVYRSLHEITAKDLRDFYQTYYVPEAMTLTIIGDLKKEEIIEKVNSTFASLAARNAYHSKAKVVDPNRFWQLYAWDFNASIFYYNRFKLYEQSQEDVLKSIFISQFLQSRLNTQLRYGDRKATYSMGTSVILRGPVGIFQIFGSLKESEYEFARDVINKELEDLRQGTLKSDIFETEKAALIGKLRVTNSASKDLEQWVRSYFYNPTYNKDFPDVVAKFESYSKADIEEFVKKNLTKNRQVLEVYAINPLNQAIFASIGLFVLVFTLGAARRHLLRPLAISRLRYIARFRMSLLTRFVMVFLFVAIVAIGAQALFFVFQYLSIKFILGIENFWLQWSIYTSMGAFSLFLFMLLIARWPSKLLLFNDSLAIKYFSYRSNLVALSDIKEISLQSFSSVWFSPRIWKCVPLTFALFSPGVYMRLNNGWAYFFELRDNKEFLTLLKELRETNEVKNVEAGD
jgi:predicted Zn-dependent peptidase